MKKAYVAREVIDNTLLAALNHESKVAVLFERDELRMVMGALAHMTHKNHWQFDAKAKAELLLADIKKLHVAAWGSTKI